LVRLEEFADEVEGGGREVARKFKESHTYLSVYLIWVLIEKGREANQHLVD